MKKLYMFLMIMMFLLSSRLYAQDTDIFSEADKWGPAGLTNVIDDNVKCIVVKGTYIVLKETISVDSGKRYILSGEFKSIGTPGALCYFGINCLDEAKKPIQARYINICTGTDTELIEPCNYSDKVLKVKNAENWVIGNNCCVAFNTDTEAKDLPNRDISRGWGISKIEQKGSYWEVTLKDSCGKELPTGFAGSDPISNHFY